jgi:uncharacterized protein YjbI with pentapeptide repeats
MASTALSPELVCGHIMVQVDILEKAVNELDARQIKAVAEQDAKHLKAVAELEANHIKAVAESEAKQSAAMQLVQSLLTQMTELRNELQEVRAHNQALAARLNAELELPRSASGASRPATFEELIQRRDALAKIKAAKMDCGMAKSAGYTCAEARAAGYTLSEAKVAWATDELRAAGYISSKGMTSRDFMDQYGAGRSNFSGLDFTGEDFEGMVLDKACTFSRCIFVGASFRSATLVGVNFSHADLSDCDLSHASLRNCTLTDATPPAKGRWGGAKLNGGTAPMKQLGFSCAEVKAMGMVQGLKAAGYTCAEAKQAGYIEGLKAAGYTCAEVKQVGYTLAEMKQGGYTCAEAKQAGYTLAEVKQAGYVEGLKAAGYTCSEAKQAGYTCAEAKQAGYVEGLKAAGYTLAEVKQGGYTCAEMKQAGFNPRECKQAGFTFQEGKEAGYSYDYEAGWGSCSGNRTQVDPRRARPPPPPPSAWRGGLRPPPCRRACGPRPVCGPPAWRARAADSRPLMRAWRPRVAAQGNMTGMGTNFVDSATCPRGTAPRCRDLKSCPLYYGRAGHLPQHLQYARCLPADVTKMVQDAGRQQEHESAS